MVNSSDYLNAFKTSIVRIFHANGLVVGAGFLVSPQYVLTCAHVVAQALCIPENSIEVPTGLIELDFPLIAAGNKLKAQVVFWRAVDSSVVGEDIAGLKLEGELPDGIQPVRLVTGDDLWGHSIRIFGFPSGHNDGVWATGELRGEKSNGWVQMEAVNVPGYRVEPGFSGAPVWDETLSGVVGMAVAAERQREGVKAAFMIPIKVLSQVWSEVVQLSQSPPINKPNLSRVQAIQARELEKRLGILEKDYVDVYNQLNYTTNAEERNNLQRRLREFEQRLNEVANELDLLSNGIK
ncbi:MAG TPA: serine protease [Cyanobacteria bacterium UBA12227]|nr:serine protease [Cyanobacteria bacterium UBA12227]HAX90389.1 serine protease [Cyanobacteria bacterium UBA11370]HBY80038.1 serine protease [Cyanobacteria bacterium UBA11148]